MRRFPIALTRQQQEAVRTVKVRTRHYAKRQLTWFRRDARVRWIPSAEINNAPDIILSSARAGSD